MIRETIICAAVKYGNKIWHGHRHTYCYTAMWDELSYTMNRKEFYENEEKRVDGFVTSTGRFVDREEAYKIHKETVGISASFDGYRNLQLYSEDLY